MSLPSPRHLSRHPAIPHHSGHLFTHFRHYSSSFQDSHSKATPKETHPRLSWHLKIQTYISSFIPLETLERTVYIQLSSYLSENDLLDSNQSGFRTGHSTEMALLTVTESLGAARALSNSSFLILLDLSSVFDTVNTKSFFPLHTRLNLLLLTLL